MEKRRGREIFIVFLLLFVAIAGCSKKKPLGDEKQDADEVEGYVCTANVKLEATREKEAGDGKTFLFLGNGKAFRIINYFAEQYSDSETEVVSADALGMTDVVR